MKGRKVDRSFPVRVRGTKVDKSEENVPGGEKSQKRNCPANEYLSAEGSYQSLPRASGILSRVSRMASSPIVKVATMSRSNIV